MVFGKLFFKCLCVVLFSCSTITARTQVFFSPDDQVTKKFVEFIRTARKTLYGAIYMLSDKTIATEFIEAKKRGVDVKLLVDRMCISGYGKGPMLVQAGISILLYVPELNQSKKIIDDGQRDFFSADPIMHHKFLIADGKAVWTGSFNWTVAANRKNQENAVIIDERDVCEKFLKQFNILMSQRCLPFKGEKKNTVVQDASVADADECISNCFLLDMEQAA